MQTIRYAARNVMRSKGRSILIGIIVVIIAFAVCISLCIRQSSIDAREAALEDMTITAQISPDRGAAMDKAMGEKPEEGEEPQEFDKDKMKDMMGEALTLDELKTYAEADSVQSFYYTLSASADAAGSLEAYSTSSSDSEDSKGPSMPEGMGSSGDFSITGYSSDDAMTDFIDGTVTIKDGQVFEEDTSDKVCLISDELATYNNLEVGDSIKLCSTEDEDQTFKLKIVGIYTNSQSSAQAMQPGGRMGMTDPANCIYTSYSTLKNIVDNSEETISGTLNGTYVLGTMEAYEAFQNEVADLGLSDEYAVSSTDLTAYEQSAQPLENLSKYAGYFVLVILGIGAVILVVLNIFATRERKYEIGVLTAIGMKKKKVASIFLSEILIITLAAVILGGSIGAVTSVPVTNALLSSSIATQQQVQDDRNGNFGRDFNGGGGGDMQNPPDKPDGEDSEDSSKGGPIIGYASDISNAVNISVLLKLLGACIALALVGSAVSVISIMRYEPLEILSSRD